MEFSEKINFFCGKNGLGKTNLLESIWMLTGTRSFRGAKDKHLVNFEEKAAKIGGFLFLEERDQEIEITFENEKRNASLNGIKKNSAVNLIGKARMVIFSPNHLSLIKDGPEKRRKFLDAALCQQKNSYAPLLVHYAHVLRQRNALLKELFHNDSFKSTLEIWDEKLAVIGAKIISERKFFVKGLKEKAYNFYGNISNEVEKLEFSYDFKSENVNEIINLLEKNRTMDIRQGYTSVGPHKDDLNVHLNGKSLRIFGSQGQQRSAVLALKLAEASVLKEKTGESPVILLDDVMGELDITRRKYLSKEIKDYQVFITSCDEPENIDEGRVFNLPFYSF